MLRSPTCRLRDFINKSFASRFVSWKIYWKTTFSAFAEHLILMIMKLDVRQESFSLIAEYQASLNQVVELFSHR